MIITILSDSPFICTGYSNQAKLLAKYLTDKGHEVHFLANSYTGQVIKKAELTDGTIFDYHIYGQMGHQYFADQISEHMKKTRSDFFIILLDTFMLHGDPKNPANGWFLNIDTSPAQTIFWYPTDGGAGLPVGCDNILRKCEKVVSMSKFGKKQAKDYHNIEADYIPLATEPDRFFKMEDKKRFELRKKWNLADKFVVGCVARNQGRKMLDREIKAFRILADRNPQAHLLLHLDPNDQAAPWSIINLIRRYNLENRVSFTKMNAMRAFDWKDMNEVYNLMDVFFLSTSGEGFGIPMIEAMACEIPVVATSYTTTPEIVEQNNAGLGVKLTGVEKLDLFELNSVQYDLISMNGTLTGSWEVERGLMDITDAVKQIEKLAKDNDLRDLMGKNGRETVLRDYIFEKNVGDEFIKLMESMK